MTDIQSEWLRKQKKHNLEIIEFSAVATSYDFEWVLYNLLPTFCGIIFSL